MIGAWQFVLIVLLFFVTTSIGVVTGSNSLITVPVMFELGVEPKTAIATNMFGLTFMAFGATLSFARRGQIDFKAMNPFVGVTLLGSALGALLVGVVSMDWIPRIVSISMIAVAVFTIFKPDVGVGATKDEVRSSRKILTVGLAFVLAIYGGFYSGGYMTVLTVVLVAFGGMSFGDSVAGTKYLNLFSSAIATAVFMWQGLVDYKLGAVLAVTMFVAAYFGAAVVSKFEDIWLKRIFLAVVFLLAIKLFV
ncbi:MAG: sulfite exporter TauE/SafE family protein [Pyrinomonadaceae bacterium]